MAKALKAPTEEYLLELKAEMERDFGTQDAQITRMREVREQRRDPGVPSDFTVVDVKVMDQTATDEIDRTSATLAVNPPELTIDPSRKGDTADRNATKREHASEAMLLEAGRVQGGIPTYAAALDAQAGDGGAWTKLVYKKDLWDERYKIKRKDFTDDPESDDGDGAENPPDSKPRSAEAKYDQATEDAKKEAGVPFRWIAVDALTFYPLFQGGEVKGGIEVSERPMSTTFRQYRLGLAANGDITSEELGQPQAKNDPNKSPKTVQFIEYWDDEWCAYLVVAGKGADARSKVVQKWRHGYGRHPYFFAPGRMMAHWANRKVGWSVSESKRSAVEYSSYLQTLHANIAAAWLPILARELPDGAADILGEDGKPVHHEKLLFGNIYNLRQGEKLVPIQGPQVSDALREQIQMNREALDRLTNPSAGPGVSGAGDSGFAIQSKLAEYRIRFNPLAEAFELMMADVTRFMWQLIKIKVKEAVWVYREAGENTGWLSLSPDDLVEPVKIKWALNPETPSAEIIKVRYWAERKAQGWCSDDQAIQALGDNPDEVREGKMLDWLRTQPEYLQLFKSELLGNIGRGDLLNLANQAQQMVQTGAVQPAGAPAPGVAGGIPDTASLTQNPGGQGSSPVGAQRVLASVNGSVAGVAASPQLQTAGATASLQSLGSGGQ